MNIIYQYYNEISLAFAYYDTDFDNGIIVIYIGDDNKPFEVACEKIESRLSQIAQTLGRRDEDVLIEIRRTGKNKKVTLEKLVD